MLRKILLTGLAVMIAVGLLPTRWVQAQSGSVADIVLIQFSYYVGISPPLTAGEMDRGELDRPFAAEYRIDPVDLRSAPLSCTSPVLPDEEIVVGVVGWRVQITMQGRFYEFRTNYGGSVVIRCVNGQPLDFNGSARGIGATISGESATTAAMNHLSGQLDVGTITIERAENPGEDDPRVFYNWRPVVYADASLGCPVRGVDYDVRDTFAYNVNLTVNGRRYNYRIRGDGGQVIWCVGGRPDQSSLGITFPAEGQ